MKKQVQHIKSPQNNVLAFANSNIYNKTVCATQHAYHYTFFATGIAKSDKH